MIAPRTLGDYELLEELARGGMGVVYRARQRSADRVVALKTVLGGRLARSRAIERFRREVRVAAGLDHPGIVPIYEIGEDGGVCFFSMKLIEGSDLASRLRDRESPLSHEQAARVLESIARAVHHAHLQGVLHRDLKPANILLDTDGHAYVTDFGLAKAIDLAREGNGDSTGIDDLTATAAVVGTPSYSSPEQSRGERELTPASDVFSLGAILYELLTGELAFQGDSSEEIAMAVRETEPAPPRTLVSDLPRDLETVCMKCLEKQPRRRYQTAGELAEELERYLAGVPVDARPISRVERVRRWCARNRAQTAAGVLLFLLAALASISVPLLRSERKAARDAESLASEMSTSASQSAAEVESKRAEVEARLDEVLLLSDLQSIREYRDEADALRPATSDLIRDMELWLEKAEKLGGRLDRHREALASLRGRALATTPEQRRRAHESSPLWDDRVRLESDRRFLEEHLERAGDDALGESDARESHAQIERISKRIARIDEQLERDEFRFATREDRWWHDTLMELVAELEHFVDPDPFKGAVAAVRNRLDFARDIRKRSIGDVEERWNEAIRSIADRDECPRYDGLEIVPQEGLVPIGRDPASKLWEFAHLESGERASRRESGDLELLAETGLVLVLLPGGDFEMGSRPPAENAGTPRPSRNEFPARRVELEPFLVSKFELTQAQWKRITGKNPSRYAKGIMAGTAEITWTDPVEQVTWGTARDALFGVGLALPTEAQWEYATRAGTTTAWWTGDAKESIEGAGNVLDSVGKSMVSSAVTRGESWLDDGFPVHAPVGSFRANPFGLHDVIGNVFEWCADEYGSYSLPVMPGTGERVAAPRRIRVFRGGGWGTVAVECRSAQRYINREGYSSNSVGVRPARALSR